MDPMTELTMSFILAPGANRSPEEEMRLAHPSSGPATFSYSALSPAAMKMSAPCSAGAFDPDTGASRNSAPAPQTKAAAALEVPASTVEASRPIPFPTPRPGAATASAHASAASG